jgi:hypothetical protein
MTSRSRTALPTIAGLAAAATLVLALRFPTLAAAGWLIAFVFLSAIPLGSVAWLMVARLTGGHWGLSLQPTFQAATAAIPLLPVAFVPVLLALRLLYPWVDPWVAGAPALKVDVALFYLNAPLFILRTGVALLGWSVLALLVPRRGGRPGILLAAAGLIFHALMVSLLSVDWILSIEPTFISSSFGATTAITQMLAALAFAALFARGLDDRALRDLAGLMLAATLAVTYLNFMAVLVIWYGDLPAKVSWLAERVNEPWRALAVATFVLGSAMPVLLLLLERVRANRMALRYVAASTLAGIALYDAFLLAPPYGAWALGTAALCATALSCAFLAIAHLGWPSVLFERVETVP